MILGANDKLKSVLIDKMFVDRYTATTYEIWTSHLGNVCLHNTKYTIDHEKCIKMQFAVEDDFNKR